MFFMIGITTGRKNFDIHQLVVCRRCGQYGSYSVFMTYTVLSLFFIPVFRWNRRYYVTTSCCGTTYQLDPEIGRMIARGESPEILPEHLTQVSGQASYRGWYSDRYNDTEYSDNYNDRYNDNYNDRYNNNDRNRYRDNDRNGDYDQHGNTENEDRYIEDKQKDHTVTVTKRCSNCGFTTEEDYAFCPKCGNRL